MLEKEGFLDIKEIEEIPGFPGYDILSKKKAAILECAQKIPCNPCEAACPSEAIKVGDPIVNLPIIDPEKCTGCGTCISKCPGLAIFVVDLTNPDHDTVMMPYEYLPVPEPEKEVTCLNRRGEAVATGRIKRALSSKASDRTVVLTVDVPKGLGMEVRGVRVNDKASHEPIETDFALDDPDDVLVCRCEEVTKKEIIEAIREGATTVDAVKRRTRAGMGLCQGRNCSRTVKSLIAKELKKPVSSIPPESKRPPVRPVKLSVFAQGEDAVTDDD